MLFKLVYAKYGVSNFFLNYRRETFGRGSARLPLLKEGLREGKLVKTCERGYVGC